MHPSTFLRHLAQWRMEKWPNSQVFDLLFHVHCPEELLCFTVAVSWLKKHTAAVCVFALLAGKFHCFGFR